MGEPTATVTVELDAWLLQVTTTAPAATAVRVAGVVHTMDVAETTVVYRQFTPLIDAVQPVLPACP